tara:strand:+ start:3209 stop:4393 length:1185 start_codon:yes stop_codon:yes gene_type:complete
MSKNFKIAMIEPIGGHGGNELYDNNLVNSINMQNKYECFLYTCDSNNNIQNKHIINSFKNIYGNTNKLFRGCRYIYHLIKSLIDAKQKKIHVLHIHFFGFSFIEYVTLFISKIIFKFTVTATIHDVKSVKEEANYKILNQNKFLTLIDGIVFHTNYAKSEFLNSIKTSLLLDKPIKTIFACDLDYKKIKQKLISKEQARLDIDLPLNHNLVLFFGQIRKSKRLDVLLEAFALVLKKHKKVKLIIAGKIVNDDINKYNRLIKLLDIGDNIIFRNEFIIESDVEKFFSSADIIALPYERIYNSGVLIRAMSFGKKIIASDFGPFKEFIQNKQNGFLFETNNYSLLADLILEVLNNKEKYKYIEINSHKYINDKFSLDKLGEQYVNFYNKIIEGSYK